MSDEAQAIYAALSARFPIEAHQTKPAGGRNLIYVDGEMVISRLNDALGFDGWSFEVLDVQLLEDEVWVRGRLTVVIGDRTVVREQAGGQIYNRKSGIQAQPARPAQPADGDRPAIPAVEAKPAVKGDITEVANDVKGAVTDCLKKCATLVGVGLYLFDPAARREVEAEMKAHQAQPRRAAPPSPRPQPTPINTKAHNAAVLTGAAPVKSEARLKLEATWNTGLAYAKSIGLDPNEEGILALDDVELGEVVDGLRSQCQSLLDQRKAAKKAAEEAATAQPAATR